MKLHESTSQVIEKSGLLGEKVSRIESSPHVFKILSNSLYSDKIGAVVRETIANAWDAHVRADLKSQAINIMCPSWYFKFFVVRDWGHGLTEEEVFNTYIVFFKSDKKDSNEEIGQFGLGAKSPYAIGQSFSVKSYQENLCSTYSMYINEKGMPACAKLSEKYTDENNGLEIIVPVKQDDISEFRNKILYYGSFYEPAPIIMFKDENEDTQLIIEKSTPILTGKDWQLISWTGYTPMAVMGNIPYKIDSNIGEIPKTISAANININFPIGSLAVTPSRESLSYTAPTIEAIRVKTKQIFEAMKGLIQDEINKCPNPWMASIKKHELNKYNLAEHVTYKKTVTMPNGDIGTELVKLPIYAKVDPKQIELNVVNRKMFKKSIDYSLFDNDSLKPDINYILLYNDLAAGTTSRVKYWYETNYLNSGDGKTGLVFKFKNLAAKNDFFEQTGLTIKDFIKTSTLPKKPSTYVKKDKNNESLNKRPRIEILKEEGSNSFYWDMPDDTFEIVTDGSDPQYYVELANVAKDITVPKVSGGQTTLEKDSLFDIYKQYQAISDEKLDLYGVKPSYVSRVKAAGWTEFVSYCRGWLLYYIEKNSLAADLLTLWNLSGAICIDFLNFVAPKLPNNHIFNELRNFHVKLKQPDFQAAININSLAKKIGVNLQEKLENSNITYFNESTFLDGIWAKYPMLQISRGYVSNSYNHSYWQTILDYIKFVDLWS